MDELKDNCIATLIKLFFNSQLYSLITDQISPQ